MFLQVSGVNFTSEDFFCAFLHSLGRVLTVNPTQILYFYDSTYENMLILFNPSVELLAKNVSSHPPRKNPQRRNTQVAQGLLRGVYILFTSIRTQRDTRKFGVAFVLRRPLRIVRNARAHERQGLQVDVATWRQI